MWSRSLLLASLAFSSTSCSPGACGPTTQLEERLLGQMSFLQADFCASRQGEVSSRCQHMSHPFPAFVRGKTWIHVSTLASGAWESLWKEGSRREWIPSLWSAGNSILKAARILIAGAVTLQGKDRFAGTIKVYGLEMRLSWGQCNCSCPCLRKRGFPGGLVIKNLPVNAGNAGLILGWGTKIPHASEQSSPQITAPEAARPCACMPQLRICTLQWKILNDGRKIPLVATKTQRSKIKKERPLQLSSKERKKRSRRIRVSGGNVMMKPRSESERDL